MFLINFKFQWPGGGGVPDPLTPLRVDPCVYMYFVYSEFYLKALERVKLNYSFTEKNHKRVAWINLDKKACKNQ